MKNILVISGSPRSNGNTHKIVKLIEERMSGFGEVDFTYLSLKKHHLDYCRGCLVCMKKGEERCPCKDDALELRDQMLAADGIIFATPVYVHTVSAMMKNFYDRFAYLCHQPRFREKAAMMIVTTELSGCEETLEYMRFPAFTWGFRLAASLGVVYPAFVESDKYREKVHVELEQAAREFYRALTTSRGAPTMRELLFFNLMKTKVTLHREKLPRDYGFWEDQGWLTRKFYNEENLPALKAMLARSLVRMRVRKMMKKLDITTR